MFAGYVSVCHSRGVYRVEAFAHVTCIVVYRGDCETHICATSYYQSRRPRCFPLYETLYDVSDVARGLALY